MDSYGKKKDELREKDKKEKEAQTEHSEPDTDSDREAQRQRETLLLTRWAVWAMAADSPCMPLRWQDGYLPSSEIEVPREKGETRPDKDLFFKKNIKETKEEEEEEKKVRKEERQNL